MPVVFNRSSDSLDAALPLKNKYRYKNKNDQSPNIGDPTY